MRYFFLVTLLLGYLMSNLMRVSGVVLLPPLAESLGLTAAAVGFLSSLFFYTYGASYGVWGVLVDNRGPFICCGLSLLIGAIGSFIMAFSGSSAAIGVGRALSGLGMASLFTGLLMYCAFAFSKENYPVLVGLCLVIGHLGTVAAVAPLGYCLDIVGPRVVFLALGIVSLLLGVILILFKKQDPRRASMKFDAVSSIAVTDVISELWRTASASWDMFPLRVVMLTWASSAAATAALQGLWAVSWIQSATKADLNTARLCATWISMGLVVGPAAGALFFKRCGCLGEKKAFLWCCIFNQLSWFFWMGASRFNDAILVFSFSGFAVGFFNGCGYVFMGNAVRNLAPMDKNASVIGVINMLLYIGVIIFQWGTGVVLDFFPAFSAGCYREEGFLIGFGVIMLIQGWTFHLITKAESFRRGTA